MNTAIATAQPVKIKTASANHLTRERVLAELKRSRDRYLQGRYKTEKEMWALEGGLRELVQGK